MSPRTGFVQHLHGARRRGVHAGAGTAPSCRASRGHASSTCLRQSGRTVTEKDALGEGISWRPDEIFLTGNHSKVVPVIRIEERDLQPGPVAKNFAGRPYWEWAHS